MTACCQRKEPRVRSGSRMLAVCRSCRRFSRIVNVIKLKKGTIEITTIRTCKKGLTFSQSRNGCMPLMPVHGTICDGIRIIRASPTRFFASSGELRMASTIAQGHLRSSLRSEAKSDSDLPQRAQTIILRSESYNFMSCCPRRLPV